MEQDKAKNLISHGLTFIIIVLGIPGIIYLGYFVGYYTYSYIWPTVAIDAFDIWLTGIACICIVVLLGMVFYAAWTSLQKEIKRKL